MERVKLERIGPVAIAVIDTPPGHAPDRQARQSLIRIAAEIVSDEALGALVLLCTGALNAPKNVVEDPAAEDGLAAACDALDRLEIPVILGLEGQVLGGGAEIALAAHFRLADPQASIGWPDIAVGRLAGGGGIQRLTRIAGAGGALECLLSGEPVAAAAAASVGILDGVVQGDLVEAVVALAGRLAGAGAGPRRSRDRTEGLDDAAAFRAATAAVREAKPLTQGTAEAAIVECVEAAMVLPFEAGVGFEIAAATALNRSDRSKALDHIRRAARAAALPERVSAGRLESVGLQGGGLRAAELAHALLAAGRTVVLSDPDPEALRAGLARIGSRLAEEAAVGRLDAAGRAQRLDRLSSARRPADLVGCSVVIFGDAGRAPPVPPGATGLRAHLSNGLFFPAAAPETDLGQGAFGLRVCDPGGGRRVIEIQPPRIASRGELAALRDLVGDIGYQPLASAAGSLSSLVGRLSVALLSACEHLLEDGASPRRIDRCLESAGYACGVFRMLDRVGLMPILRDRQMRAESRDPRDRYVVVLDRLCEAGRTGVAAGAGFYNYTEGLPEGVPSAEVEALLAAGRAEAGSVSREIDDAEILRRCRLALTLEGVRLMADGTARRAADIDVAAVHGLGYPRESGGPMYQAGREGLAPLRDAFRELARTEDARFWAAPAYLDRLIANVPQRTA